MSVKKVLASVGATVVILGSPVNSVAEAEKFKDYENLTPQTENVMVVDQQSNSIIDLVNGAKYDSNTNTVTLTTDAVESSEGKETTMSAVKEGDLVGQEPKSPVSVVDEFLNGKPGQDGLIDGVGDLTDKMEEKRKSEEQIEIDSLANNEPGISLTPPLDDTNQLGSLTRQNKYSIEGLPTDNKNELGNSDLSSQNNDTQSENQDLSANEDNSAEIDDSSSETISMENNMQ